MILELIAVGLGCIALGAVVMYLREREDKREWAEICRVLGNEYDKLVVEAAQHVPKMNVKEQEKRWLN